ncbi:MAG: hypothetical protein CL671_03125 [Balneola sp.]|nr:hypothetical protein [Balneola sp.]MAC06617.1 hypothetical protein [Balneola sp.]MAO78925.1 hypothetical protein [Balneola sp.]MBF63584.1 hypothetical protein [Balneola sp.]HAW80310.1 hypothetical protein [Balneola sp.]|tara:strand:- start:7196 stop:7636 length:441 start_codon:yes stop_codon:yes gene_type:complete
MIQEIQSAFINRFEAVRTASGDTDYPKSIKPYSDELSNLGKVNIYPSVYVNIAVNGLLEADDITGAIHTASIIPEIIVFEDNKASKNAKYTKLATLFDWVYDALKGHIFTIEGVPVIAAKRITWRAFTETKPGYIVIMPEMEVHTG